MPRLYEEDVHVDVHHLSPASAAGRGHQMDALASRDRDSRGVSDSPEVRIPPEVLAFV